MPCVLMLPRIARTRLVYLGSMPIDPFTIEDYLHRLPGIPDTHVTLTGKLPARPRLLERVRQAVR